MMRRSAPSRSPLPLVGPALDADRNARGQGVVSRDDAKVKILVVPTDEERNIARYTSKVLGF